ncbi:hypothetical protein J7363_04715 [Phaeobacter italicus]|uniref:hypothetical protein n=1 Tax=Phaeobacter italicus TaxID=481446 RepID=UPI001ADC2C74|nr:hypothetical protein [Phaeobacter italicus]MBO9441383.1 hypothetical protein [Phaeobacter italicus]
MNDFADTAPAEQSPAPEAQVQSPEPQTEGQSNEAAPTADAEPRRSRREALEKAFESIDEPEKGKSAENKAVNEAEVQKQERGPDGKFVSKSQPERAEVKPEAKPEAKPEGESSHAEAPSRFSADAKAAWKDAPEPIRAEAHRAIREMEQGIAEYKSRVEPLEPFYQMAEQSGVKLEDALGRYVNLENTLRQDPVRGFQEIAANMGLSLQQLSQMLQTGQPGQADPRDQQILALQHQLSQLQQGFGEVNKGIESQQQQAIENQIAQFAADHPRFSELEQTMTELIQTGFAKDLQDAYDKADRLNPAPAPEPQQAPPATPAHTRVSQSVTGAPSAGSNPAQRKPSTNRQEAIQRAMSAAGF